MLTELRILFDRDISGLRQEVERYPDDVAIWRQVPGCPNSGGTLVLHTVGNLRHFIGAQLGQTGYVRDREAEFASRGLSRSELLELVTTARSEVNATLMNLDAGDLSAMYPLAVADRRFATSLWLLHLSTHLAYHLGQIDYHRRTVTGDSSSAGVVAASSLPSTM